MYTCIYVFVYVDIPTYIEERERACVKERDRERVREREIVCMYVCVCQ